MKGVAGFWRFRTILMAILTLVLLAVALPGLADGGLWTQAPGQLAVVNSVLISQVDPNKFYAGTSGGLFSGQVSGGTLTLSPGPFSGNIDNLVFGGPGDDVLLGSVEHQGTVAVMRSTNGGQSFSPVPGIPPDLGSTGFDMSFSKASPGVLVLGGYSNSQGGLVIMQSQNGGANWAPMPPLGEMHFPGSVVLAGSPPLVAAGGSGFGVVTCPIGGGSWTQTSAGQSQLGWALPGLADPVVNGTLYFGNADASTNPFGYRLDNFGQSNAPLNFPQGMTRPISSLGLLLLQDQKERSAEVAGSVIFAGTEGGKVWKTLDRGVTWIDASAGLPGDKINCLSSGGQFMLAGVGSKGLWYRMECSLVCDATATPSAGPAPLTVQFAGTATATGCTGTPVFYWTFGDETTSSEQNPSHIYENPGTYNWTMTASLPGATCTKSGTVTVTPPCSLICSASANPTSGVAPLSVVFDSTISAENCQVPVISWAFGDGSTSSEADVTHIYQNPGVFNWTLTITADGKSCTQSGTAVVASPCTLTCVATADPPSGDAPLAVSFASTYEAPGCTGMPDFDWDFGDFTMSDQQNPSHTYTASGTFTWTLKITLGGKSCQQSGTVTVGGALGKVVGNALIQGPNFEYWWPNGPVVKGLEAKLKNLDTGETFTQVLGADCYFSFEGKPEGLYALTATMKYRDNIGFDSVLNGMGCLKPEGGWVEKEVTSSPREFELKGAMWEGTNFPPPVIMLHGLLECYEKWYSDAPGNVAYWDNAAREDGFISFTPSYAWWGEGSSWPGMAEQVAGEIESDVDGLVTRTGTAGNPLPFSIVAHDAGGLVARVMCNEGQFFAGQFDFNRLQAIYLMGTPNSGTDLILGGGEFSPMSVYSIMQRFNEIYPGFGSLSQKVYAIGGNAGLWGLQNGDGRVSTYSAFNVARLECDYSDAVFPVCSPFVSGAFDSGEAHIFPYKHSQLGGPSSEGEILSGVILKDLRPSQMGADPGSPAGALVWGTNSRTVGTASGSTQGYEADQEFPFTLGQCDGMAVLAWLTEGSASFEIVDPDGHVVKQEAATEEEPGFEFTKLDPMPGDWELRVIPGASGAQFRSVFLEDSPFGILGYASKEAYAPEEAALLRMDGDGLLTDVAFGAGTATLYDLSGAAIQTVPLFDDGQHKDGAAGDGHFGGEVISPREPGSYRLLFYAAGSYGGSAFARTSDARLNVVSRQHLFTGEFTVWASSSGDDKFDSIAMSAVTQSPRMGEFFVLNGDLYDGDLNFVARAHGLVRGDLTSLASGTLIFPLAGIKCSQFSKAFSIRNLELSDSHSLAPLDRWPDSVNSQVFDPSQFICDGGGFGPSLGALFPDEGVRGMSVALSISGRNFKDGASVSLGDGIAVGEVKRVSESAISASVEISSDATMGVRALTVSNPGEVAATLSNAFEVKQNRAPIVFVQSPSEGATVKAKIAVSAVANDDVGVTQVAFKVDGDEKAVVMKYPFRFEWDTMTASEGAHRISATATDGAGLVAMSPEVRVIVKNISIPGDCDGSGSVSIGEVQKAINMFLGTIPPDCGVDCNGDGSVSIGELQKVINAFLGLPSSC